MAIDSVNIACHPETLPRLSLMVAQIELSPATRLGNALLGDIDVRGVRGRRRINRLVSALTEWRIRLCEIARSSRGDDSGSYATGPPIRTRNGAGPGGERLAHAIHGLNGFCRSIR